MRYSEAREILAEAYEARSRPRTSTPSPVGARKGASHDEKTSSANIRTWQGHIDRLADSIKYHQSRKPGWSDWYRTHVTKKDINRKVAELKKFHKHFTARQKIAVANHKAGNYEANRDHYTLTNPVGD